MPRHRPTTALIKLMIRSGRNSTCSHDTSRPLSDGQSHALCLDDCLNRAERDGTGDAHKVSIKHASQQRDGIGDTLRVYVVMRGDPKRGEDHHDAINGNKPCCHTLASLVFNGSIGPSRRWWRRRRRRSLGRRWCSLERRWLAYGNGPYEWRRCTLGRRTLGRWSPLVELEWTTRRVLPSPSILRRTVLCRRRERRLRMLALAANTVGLATRMGVRQSLLRLFLKQSPATES